MSRETFMALDFGSRPTTVEMKVIDVEIDPTLIINDFAKAYINELRRRNPIRAQEVNITEEELFSYFKGLLGIRIESVEGVCDCWRLAKVLLIPAWIEFTLSQIGDVVDRDRGLKLHPVFHEEYDINRLLETSNKLSSFISDGVTLLKDAFPRSRDGDVDTMSMAVINGYVQSQTKTAHPIASYVAAFLGFKLKEGQAFNMLYRVRYDDVNFIRQMLLSQMDTFT